MAGLRTILVLCFVAVATAAPKDQCTNPTCADTSIECNKPCAGGCCPGSKPILHEGSCIKEQDCPTCPGNQVYIACASPCDPTCLDPNPGPCPWSCEPGCDCPIDVPYWDENAQQCVALADCSIGQGPTPYGG